jgi:hypothetical protein
MADETTEPAIPIIAALPFQAHRDLNDLAEVDLGGLSNTGLRIAWDITETKHARISAVGTVMHVGGGTIDVGVQVQYTGQWTAGGFVQWIRKD